MIRSSLLGVSALAVLALQVPAQADWVRLNDVRVNHQKDHDQVFSRFAGPVETLSFTARGSDIQCRNIVAEYGNGQKQTIFSGRLYRDKPANRDVRGFDRRIDRLTMTCRADNWRGGTLEVNADVGRFRMAWEKSKDWAGRMARDVKRDLGMDDRHGWTTVGRENFSGRHDSETSYAGWRGKKIERIALRPIDNAARCMRVSATFDNGRTRDLAIDRSDVIDRGEMKIIDLPGDVRNLSKVYLTCRAVGDRDVTIEVLARS